MRRLASVAILVLAFAPAASAKPLKRGSRGKEVKVVQRVLHLADDGIFGKGTARAVRRYQRRHGLAADGVVGSATWQSMLRARRHRRARAASAVTVVNGVRVMARGPSVRLAQRKLGIAADGVFGPGTAGAVRRLQRQRGMTPDGIVGPATWTALGVRGRHPVLKRAGSRSGRSRGAGVIARAVAAANRIARLPYRYGGGHGTFHDSAYDCSGSVSYVLHAIGRLGRPRDSSGLMRYGAPGPGRYITIYANPGHAYMIIGGRRFDTTGRYENGTRWQRTDRSAGGYVARHPPGL
jgi:peptidoglycan hydrolase-like protein with peptidoglycan-binding domain